MDDYVATGRVDQKKRTRAALVAAARELMEEVETPSVVEVAARARVSPATAYRYFPTQEALLSEAAMAPLLSAIEGAVEEAEARSDPVAALDHLLGALFHEIAGNEAAFRLLYARSLEAAPVRGLDQETERGVGRGGRRPGWIRRVLASLEAELGTHSFDRLVWAVTATVGIEALSALRDVCGLPLDRALDVMRWSALSLVRQARSSAS